MTETHACPGGCGADVPDDRFSCREDWFRLPEAIRFRIRNHRLRTVQHTAAMADALRWYAAHARCPECRSTRRHKFDCSHARKGSPNVHSGIEVRSR